MAFVKCTIIGLQETRQPVAVKAVKLDDLKSKIFENLQSEIQILKSLSHRHITKLVDIVVCGLHQLKILPHLATSAPRDTSISSWNTVQEATLLII